MHSHGVLSWFLISMNIVLIGIAAMALVTSVRYLYGKPVLMKTLYKDEMGRLGYVIIAAFVVIAGLVLLYMQLK